MQSLKLRLSILSLAFVTALTFMPVQAQAYDKDTHFYATALYLIYCGIKPAFAFKIAAAAQQIDESKISTPMFTERQRRLFHFPQELLEVPVPEPTAEELKQFEKLAQGKEIAEINAALEQLAKDGARDVVHGPAIHALAGVVRNNPFAYNLILYGALRNSIWMIGGGLHTWMDSYGHENFSAAIGHANAGHGPDRPYWYWDKYLEMVHGAMQIMVRIRHLLPANALEPNFKLPGTNKSALDATADEIFENFKNNKDVTSVLSRNILKSKEYTYFVLTRVFVGLYQMKAVIDKDEIVKLLNNEDLFSQGKDCYEILADVIEKYLHMTESERAKIFDLQIIRNDLLKSQTLKMNVDKILALKAEEFERYKASVKDQIQANRIKDPFRVMAEEMAESILLTYVPKELSNERSFLVERDNAFREFEMKTRIENVQNLIYKYTNIKVVFVESNPEKLVKEMIENDGDLEKTVKALEDIQVVTLSFSEKMAWRWQIFRYYLVDLILGLRLKNGIKDGFKKNWWKPLNWITATSLSHTYTDPRVILVQYDKEFKGALATGVFKKLLTEKEAKKIIDRHDQLQKKLQAAIQKEPSKIIPLIFPAYIPGPQGKTVILNSVRCEGAHSL